MSSRWKVAFLAVLLILVAASPSLAQEHMREIRKNEGWTLVKAGDPAATDPALRNDLYKDGAGRLRNGYGFMVDGSGKRQPTQPMWVGSEDDNGDVANVPLTGRGGQDVYIYFQEDQPHKMTEYGVAYNDGTWRATGEDPPQNPNEFQKWIIKPLTAKGAPLQTFGRGTVIAPVFAAPGSYAAGNDDGDGWDSGGSGTDDSDWDWDPNNATGANKDVNDIKIGSGTYTGGDQDVGTPTRPGSGSNLYVRVRDTTPPLGAFAFIPEDTRKQNRVFLMPGDPGTLNAIRLKRTLGLKDGGAKALPINAYPPPARKALMAFKGRNFKPPEDENFQNWGKDVFFKTFHVPYGDLKEGDLEKLQEAKGTAKEGAVKVTVDQKLDTTNAEMFPGFQGLFVPAHVPVAFQPLRFEDNGVYGVKKTWKLVADGQELQEVKTHRFDVPNFPKKDGGPEYKFVCEMQDRSGNKTTWEMPIWVFEPQENEAGEVQMRKIDFKHGRGD